jgi:hypothetical protein
MRLFAVTALAWSLPHRGAAVPAGPEARLAEPAPGPSRQVPPVTQWVRGLPVRQPVTRRVRVRREPPGAQQGRPWARRERSVWRPVAQQALQVRQPFV